MTDKKQNADSLMGWMRDMLRVWPRGGKATFAAELGCKPSNFSHLLLRGKFCEKTIKAMQAMDKLRSDKFSTEDFPVQSSTTIDGRTFEERKSPSGSFYTWTDSQ